MDNRIKGFQSIRQTEYFIFKRYKITKFFDQFRLE